MQLHKTLRAIALLEGLKGAAVLAAGIGFLSQIHAGAQIAAERIVAHLHLNPAKDIPRVFVEYSAHLTSARLAALSALAIVYSLARLVEAYGLWNERPWAEWFAIVTAGIYVPFELVELFVGNTWAAVAALAVNAAIIIVMALSLRASRAAAAVTR